jgi:hypothetical protein
MFKHGIWLEDVKESAFSLSISNKQYRPNKYTKLCNDILVVTEETPKAVVEDIHIQIPHLMETTNLSLETIKFQNDMPDGVLGRAFAKFILLSNDIGKQHTKTSQKIDKDTIEDNIIKGNAELHFIENSTRQSNIKRKNELIHNIGFWENKISYNSFTYEGDNRNQILDHEFYHCLWYERNTTGEWSRYLHNHDEECRKFCRDTKISFYGAEYYVGEPSAETYAYWKDGNRIPRKLEHNFRRIEEGKI